MAAIPAAPGQAQAPPRNNAGLPLIRDAEIESLLKDYTLPILKAAGLSRQNIQIVILNDKTFNAFVADGRRIFVNVGALIESTTPNQIIGVLAHEAGHIAGGHLGRMQQQLAAAQTASIIAMLLAAGAIAAGASSRMRGDEMQSLAAGTLLGPQEMIRRSFLAYARTEEQAADKAGLSYLNATGQSARGMVDTFKRFANQVLLSSRYIDPYAQSHPMPADRVASLEEAAKQSPHYNKLDPPALQARHDMMRAKLVAFIERPETINRRYPPSDTSLPARYARAIAAYRFASVDDARRAVDGLIQTQPGNAYFWELKGQTLLEGGRPREAVEPLRKAASLTRDSNLIRVMLGQALVASGDNAHTDEAIRVLSQEVQRDPDIPEAFTQLAIAYGRKGDQAHAELASAQAAFARGDYRTSKELATRAQRRFPNGSPGWLKADDIMNYKAPDLRRGR